MTEEKLKHKRLFTPLFFQILIPASIAVTSWFVINNQNAKRDRKNKLRDIKIQYLTEAYKKLTNSSYRDPNNATYHRDIESAISEIELFGTRSQISTLKNQLNNIKNGPLSVVPLTNIIRDLRNDLRIELQMDTIDSDVNWIRYFESDSERIEVQKILDTMNRYKQ